MLMGDKFAAIVVNRYELVILYFTWTRQVSKQVNTYILPQL